MEYRLQSPDQTAPLHSVGSSRARPAGQPRSSLERHPPPPPTRNAAPLASPGLSALLEIQIPSSWRSSPVSPGHPRLDSANGQRQPSMGCRAHSGRTSQTGYPGRQSHHPEISTSNPTSASAQSDLVHVSPESHPGPLGVRFLARHRPLLQHRIGFAAGRSLGLNRVNARFQKRNRAREKYSHTYGRNKQNWLPRNFTWAANCLEPRLIYISHSNCGCRSSVLVQGHSLDFILLNRRPQLGVHSI